MLARLLLLLVAFVPLLGTAQSPIAWSYYAPFYDVKLIQDTSGNTFAVGVVARASEVRLHVVKFSSTGAVLGESSVGLPNTDVYKVVEPSIAGTRILAGFRSNQDSLLIACNLSDASLSWNRVLTGRRLFGIHATAVQLVTTEEDDVHAFAVRRALGNGTPVGTTNVTSIFELQQSVMDASGHVYLAGRGSTSTSSRLVRVNAAGSIHYDNAITFIGYDSRNATAMVYNPATQQVLIGYYAVLSGQASSNALVYRAAISNGSGATWTFDSSVDDVIQSILPQPDASAVIVMVYWNLSTTYGTRIVKRSISGTDWSVSYTRNAYLGGMGVQDSSGNIVVARLNAAVAGTEQLIEKRSLETGDIIWQHRLQDFSTTDVISSPTGMPIVNSVGWTYALQGLSISFDRTQVIGGLPITLTLQLPLATPVSNLPVLLFSNAPELPVPASINLPLGSTGTTVPINTLGVTATKSATVNVRHAGFIVQKSVTLLPPVLSTLVVNPVQVTGGNATQGTITIGGDAPTGGWVVNLSSGNAAATVPATATIPATLSSAQFAISTNPVSANTGVVISASKNSVTRTAFMAVNAPALTTFTLASSSILGGQNGSLTVNLNGTAPTGGFSISLISGAPALVVLPSSTAVPAGTTTRNLAFSTADVTASINVTLIAHRGNVVRTQTLTLTP